MYDDDTLYRALLARDAAYDGFAFVGVRTTGIYCRLTCPARKPNRENVAFFATPAAARVAGYRACKRCDPDAPTGQIDSLIPHLLARFAADPEGDWTDAALHDKGYEPATVRRKFKRHYGQTFQQVIRAQRLGRAQDQLRDGNAVIDAQLDAAFGSSSGFRDAFTRLTGQPPARAGAAHALRADWVETPLGPMMALVDETRIHLLEFHDRIALPTELKALQKKGYLIAHGRNDVTGDVERNLAAYFDGAPDWTVTIAEHGSAYSRSVWAALRRIPFGETRSYGAIAAELGQSGARAVARANGANQIALIIPCHRVIGADGTLTGYGGKIWRKQWLLRHEQRHSLGAEEKLI